MSRVYKVELIDAYTGHAQVKQHTCDDVQIKPDSIKFLNGKGAAAAVVAYYPANRVMSIVEVTA
uniref:Uncharacterized protein n=1 Tax=Pseudomonas phage Drael01 TaxID=3138533 RepID=A0AAU6W174_9VIRU